jgi:hypothetical protein
MQHSVLGEPIFHRLRRASPPPRRGMQHSVLGAPIFYRLRRASPPPRRGMPQVGKPMSNSHIRGQFQSRLKTATPPPPQPQRKPRNQAQGAPSLSEATLSHPPPPPHRVSANPAPRHLPAHQQRLPSSPPAKGARTLLSASSQARQNPGAKPAALSPDSIHEPFVSHRPDLIRSARNSVSIPSDHASEVGPKNHFRSLKDSALCKACFNNAWHLFFEIDDDEIEEE